MPLKLTLILFHVWFMFMASLFIGSLKDISFKRYISFNMELYAGKKVTFYCVFLQLTDMSLCDDALLCNFPKCRTKLNGFAWVTACSHVFCDQHGSGEFSRSPAICPACSSALSGKLDIVRTELSPSEEYKAMVLAGLRPDIILDISTRALSFWSYQVTDSSNMSAKIFFFLSLFSNL